MINTKTETSSGLRFNEGKIPLHLISWGTIVEVAKVLRFGATKYAARNWEKGLSFSDTFSSLQRHLVAWYNGEERDPETKELHLAHVMCNAMFLLHFTLKGTGTDDRPIKQEKKEPLPDAITERQQERAERYERDFLASFAGNHPVVPSRVPNVQAYLCAPNGRIVPLGCGCDRRMAGHDCSHTNCD